MIFFAKLQFFSYFCKKIVKTQKNMKIIPTFLLVSMFGFSAFSQTTHSRQTLEQGVYEFEYNNYALPTGLYFVKLIFNDYAFVKQVIKLK